MDKIQKKMIYGLENSLKNLDNNCTGETCMYGEVCDKINCIIKMEMLGKPLPPKAQKLKDDFDEMVNDYYVEYEETYRNSIKIWHKGAYRLPECQSECLFGDVCKKELLKVKGFEYCYGEIIGDIPRKFSDREFKNLKIPSNIMNKLEADRHSLNALEKEQP